jgi:prepilin-type N-terminal cleavage/methylation domain-containing protein
MTHMSSRRHGFTLMEVTIVSGLMAVLAMLLSSAWIGVGRPAADLVTRSQLVQERDMAIVALSRDLAGSLNTPNRTGGKQLGRWIGWQAATNAEQPQNADLRLLYDGRTDPSVPISYSWALPNTRVLYLVAANTLIRRENDDLTTDFTVARYVDGMKVTAISGRPDALNIVLCFKHQKVTLTCDLTAEMP